MDRDCSAITRLECFTTRFWVYHRWTRSKHGRGFPICDTAPFLALTVIRFVCAPQAGRGIVLGILLRCCFMTPVITSRLVFAFCRKCRNRSDRKPASNRSSLFAMWARSFGFVIPDMSAQKRVTHHWSPYIRRDRGGYLCMLMIMARPSRIRKPEIPGGQTHACTGCVQIHLPSKSF